MVVVMKPGSTEYELDRVCQRLEGNGLEYKVTKGKQETLHGKRTVISMIGDETRINLDQLQALDSVERVIPISKRYKLISKELYPRTREVRIVNKEIGNDEPYIIAGPCAVESRQQLLDTAYAVKEAGASALRGGAYKPRTDPYSFEGLGEEGLKYLAEARERTGLPIVTELMDREYINLFQDYNIDVWQIGARNSRNYSLLDRIAEETKDSDIVILLKRGDSCNLEEWLCSAERVAQGNPNIILCERGIKTFEQSQRNTADVGTLAKAKQETHLPVIGDPSHSTGERRLVEQIGNAYIGAGADGLIVEATIEPEKRKCDGKQSLTPEQFEQSMKKWKNVYKAAHQDLE